MVFGVIKSPAKAIAATRKNEKKIVELLLANSLLIALASGLLLARFSVVSQAYLGAAVLAASTLFLVVFVGSMFFGYVLQIIATTLGGKGRYIDGLACITCGMAAIAVGLFASSLLLFVPILGVFFSMLIVALTAALSLATLYRAIKELFRVDMIVSFVAVSILLISVIIAVYSVVLLSFANKLLLGV